jgi:hypothetical protein
MRLFHVVCFEVKDGEQGAKRTLSYCWQVTTDWPDGNGRARMGAAFADGQIAG